MVTISTAVETVKFVSEKLKGNKKVVLVGASGVGKTWTARKVSELAIKEKKFAVALWVFPNGKYDVKAICETIARQLDPLPTAEDWEVDIDIAKKQKADSDKKDEEGDSAENDIKKVRDSPEHLQEMIAKARDSDKEGEHDNVLIILDDVQSTEEEKQIVPFLEKLLNKEAGSSLKVLITQANGKVIQQENLPEATSDQEVQSSEASYEVVQEEPSSVKGNPKDEHSSDEEVIKVEPWRVDESLKFLREKVGREALDNPPMEDLAKEFIGTTKYLPAKIISLAKVFRYFCDHESETRIVKLALEEVSEGGSYSISKLLKYIDDIVPRSVIVDCCRWRQDEKGSHFFLNRGSIHYTELIAYWLIEGYLGHVDSIAKAYQRGHSVLMELVDSQVLKTLDSGYVIMDKPILDFDDSNDRYGFGGIASLGLTDLSKWEGFGTLTQTDKIIRSIRTSEKDEEIFTLILSGNQCEKIPKILEVLKEKLEKPPPKKNDKTVEEKKEMMVRVLALLNPNLTSLTLPPDMNKLAVLVLRSCVFLETIQYEFDPGNLTVLEISKASSLKEISDGFFDNMRQLQSLHLSELTFESLPLSLYKLEELRWLIIRGCSNLKRLDSLKLLTKLLVLEVSGATTLGRFRDKTFKNHKHLRVLNVSHSGLDRLPKFRGLKNLTHLLVSGCRNLTRLPKTVALTSLQTLDVSGCIKIEEFHEESLENPESLNVIDLSETFLDIIPPKINPRQLVLKGCSRLKELRSIEVLKKIEVLDLSSTKCLAEIDESFFDNLSSLQTLNLSRTGIKKLPSFPEKSNLRRLSLSGCTFSSPLAGDFFNRISSLEHLDLSDTEIKGVLSLSNLSNLSFLSLRNCSGLESIPALETLTSLEELNLCGVSCLGEGETGFLEKMDRLRILDLSETKIQTLPSMSHLGTLEKLFLRDCSDLETVPNLEELTTLEVLDISGTKVADPQAPSGFRNLKHLLVRGSSQLEEFLQLDVPEVSGPTINQGTSKLNRVEYLDLPVMTVTEGASKKMKHQWSIFNFNKPSRFVSAHKLHEILKNDPSLLKTSFKQFHLCIRPTNVQGDMYSYGNDIMFNDVRFLTAMFDKSKGERSLEIQGFDDLPEDVEALLCNADYVFLVGNSFKNWSFGNSLEALKGCWIERCTEIEDVSCSVQEGSFATVGETLEILGISNAISLRKLHCGGFKNLKSLYLDCCPELSTVFLSGEVPRNLEVLHVKFCDKLKSLFEETSNEPELHKLTTLYLLELPELEKIGCKLPAQTKFQAWECPKLKIEQGSKMLDCHPRHKEVSRLVQSSLCKSC